MAKAATKTKAPARASAYKVSFVPVNKLTAYARNARTHSQPQIEALMKSFREFGYTNPVLADAAGIVAGHGRVLAASLMYEGGETLRLPSGEAIPPGTIPVADVSGWSETQRRAYVLADNRLAELAGWDKALLRDELIYLDGLEDIDLTSAGFYEADVCKFIAMEEASDATVVLPTASEMADQARDAWKGMPEFDQQNKKAFRSFPIHFRTQEDVDAFAKLIGQNITDNTRFVWFPDIEIESYVDKRYDTVKGEPAENLLPRKRQRKAAKHK